MQTAAALLIKNLGKSILGEGSEELFTELANAAADTLIMGDLSDYNLAVRQYKAQGESEEEARRHAGWDVAKQAGLAFAGGGLMGFGSAAGGMAYNGAANRYAAPRAVESGSFYNALQYGLAQGEDTAAGRLARELAGRDTASSADVMRMLRAAESRQAEGGPGAQALVDPQLYTRAEVQGMSAGEVRENYDAIQESMRLWDKNGELAQGVNSPETQTSAAQEAAPVRVGKNTVIQRPYNGTVPKVKKDTQYEIVSISSTALEQAETQITAAQAQAESGKSFKKSLTSFYREAMGNLFGGRAVQVENVRFEDQPYDVTLNTKVISKVISDPHLTAEKLAVFRHIENVVRNAEYLGSGQYTAHGAKTKPATRYDYFETQAIIGGQEYTVSFDVEVYPDRNNYRTHRVVNNLELSPAADGTNNTKKERPPVSAVQTAYSGADARTIQAAAERGFVPYNSIAQTGENATGFSGPAAERTSDVSAVPSALNPAPQLYTRAEVQGMSAGEVRENYDAIQESMRLWDKNGELLQSAETKTQTSKSNTEDIEVDVENTAVNDNPNTHTPEEMQRIEEYKQAVDPELVVYYDAVKNGEQNLPPYPVAQVSRRMADTIKTLTGMDVSDNTIVLDKNGVEHINRRHGKTGQANTSMANTEDVGRIKYVLEHFDGATLEPTFAKGYSRKNGKPAPKVVFYKKINGTYYVVEAASDANTKKNYIVSAYINKKIEGGQPLDVQAPKITSEPSTTNPSDKSIPHFPEKSTAPRLYTRAEVQGMSAGEVRENYDAVRKSMEMWDENGELQGGTQSRMVDRQAPGEDNETTSGNERLYTRAEVQRMSEEEQLANVDAIRESMGLWDAEGKLAEQGSNSPDDGWDVQGKEAFKSNEEAYEYYLKVANELDVSTSFNTAVFYSGPGNRALAEAFARENNKTTLEITEGGKYLDALHLFSNESALTTEQAANVWKKLSERYAQGASGNAYGFVKGSRDGSIFNTVEYPALKSNPDITNIFTELFQKGENE